VFLVGLVLLIGTAGAGAFLWWIPRSRAALRERNERKAVDVLASLSSAEGGFRANDRDGNGVLDFWTGDVAGLHQFHLIDRAVAEADVRPLTALVPQPIPKDGYFFRALEFDDSVAPPEPYRQETDKKSGKVHHSWKFGYVAYPSEPGVTGNQILIINENCTVFRHRASIPVPRSWPSDPAIIVSWSVYGRTRD
jgi:hypothetical protein